MSLKYAIFKICPSWRQKVVPVFGFRRLKPHFFAPKITENGRFRVQKNGTSDAQIQIWRPLFVANNPQKWWFRLLFHLNIIFGRFLGKFLKSRILGSFLADFPL